MRRQRFVVALVLSCATAAAGWSPDPAVNTPVATSFNRESDPLVVGDGAGGVIVFWREHVLSPPPSGYYRYYLRATRLDAAGTLVWAQPTALGQIALTGAVIGGAAATGGGGFIVSSSRLNEPDYNIGAARLDASGVVPWNDYVVFTNGVQIESALTSDGQEGAIVAWQDSRSGAFDVYAQRLDGNGAHLWQAGGVAVCDFAGAQTRPQVVPDGSGGAIVAWIDGRAGNGQVFAQRVGADGSRQWTPDGVALAPAAGDQTDMALASDGAGGAIAVWQDAREAGDPDVYAQRINGLGAPQWAASGVQVATAPSAVRPVLAPDGAGGAVVAWSDARHGATDLDVFAQRLLPSGGASWTANGVLVSGAPGNQTRPTLTVDGLGGAIVAWEDARAGTGDIYAQRLDPAGLPLWAPEGRPISTAPAAQRAAAIAPDGAGGAILAWADARASLEDVYAQHVDAGGGLPVTLERFVIE